MQNKINAIDDRLKMASLAPLMSVLNGSGSWRY